MIEKNSLLKKIGFYKTLEILNIQGRSMKLRTFYEKLNKKYKSGFGRYYNAFYRTKDVMIAKRIIEIYYGENNKTKNIKLTRKGMTIKQTLKALVEVID